MHDGTSRQGTGFFFTARVHSSVKDSGLPLKLGASPQLLKHHRDACRFARMGTARACVPHEQPRATNIARGIGRQYTIATAGCLATDAVASALGRLLSSAAQPGRGTVRATLLATCEIFLGQGEWLDDARCTLARFRPAEPAVLAICSGAATWRHPAAATIWTFGRGAYVATAARERAIRRVGRGHTGTVYAHTLARADRRHAGHVVAVVSGLVRAAGHRGGAHDCLGVVRHSG